MRLARLLLMWLVPSALAAQGTPPPVCADIASRATLLANKCWFELRDVLTRTASVDGSPDRALYAGAVAHAFNRQDDAARLLRAWLAARGRDPARAPRATRARETLADVEVRRGRYAAAAAQYDTLRQQGVPGPEAVGADAAGDTLGGGSFARDARLWRALAHTPPQQVARSAGAGAVRIPLERDPAGLPTLAVEVNGRRQRMVFDTGAGLSVLMASVADTLGARFVGDTVYARAGTGVLVPARLAVVDSLRLGDATVRHVVCLVFADRDLTFADGRYRIPAILGAPVITALRRIALLPGDTLVVGAPPARPARAGGPTLAFDGTQVLVRGTVAGRAGTYLFDTGAQASTFYPAFAAAHGALLAAGTDTTVSVGSAGGARAVRGVRLAAVTLHVGGRTIALRDVLALQEPPDPDAVSLVGALGQDALRALGGVRLDFVTMRVDAYAR